MYTRYDELQDQAIEFDYHNPIVYKHFCRFTFELINRGFTHNSVTTIFERIRWECDLPGLDGKTTFKLNNNHRPFYSRWFLSEFTKHNKFFTLREQISKYKPALGLPPLGPQDYPQEKAK